MSERKPSGKYESQGSANQEQEQAIYSKDTLEKELKEYRLQEIEEFKAVLSNNQVLPWERELVEGDIKRTESMDREQLLRLYLGHLSSHMPWQTYRFSPGTQSFPLDAARIELFNNTREGLFERIHQDLDRIAADLGLDMDELEQPNWDDKRNADNLAILELVYVELRKLGYSHEDLTRLFPKNPSKSS